MKLPCDVFGSNRCGARFDDARLGDVDVQACSFTKAPEDFVELRDSVSKVL